MPQGTSLHFPIRVFYEFVELVYLQGDGIKHSLTRGLRDEESVAGAGPVQLRGLVTVSAGL